MHKYTFCSIFHPLYGQNKWWPRSQHYQCSNLLKCSWNWAFQLREFCGYTLPRLCVYCSNRGASSAIEWGKNVLWLNINTGEETGSRDLCRFPEMLYLKLFWKLTSALVVVSVQFIIWFPHYGFSSNCHSECHCESQHSLHCGKGIRAPWL